MIDMKPKAKKELIRRCLLILAIIGVVGSSGYLVYDLVWLPIAVKMQNDAFDVDENQSSNAQQNEEAPAVQEKYTEIKSQYNDFAGKLIVKGLKMDFPVMQAEDNDYYLRHNIDGEEDKHGALFVDYRNNLSKLNHNTIVFGHNMRDGTQFGMLGMYKKLSTYEACPVITFNTLYRDYKWKVFAAFLINTKPEHDNGHVFNYMRTDFGTEQEFKDYYQEAMERSYFITDVDVNYGDKILTLSTCSALIDESRFVVLARLVRDGESEKVDTSTARINTNQRFPQAWYDENNRPNPYVD